MTNANEHGHVIDWDNNENKIYLSQQAYLSGTNDNPYYCASGEDAEGNEYKVIWKILACYLPLNKPEYETTDESDMCDWDEYEVIAL